MTKKSITKNKGKYTPSAFLYVLGRILLALFAHFFLDFSSLKVFREKAFLRKTYFFRVFKGKKPFWGKENFFRVFVKPFITRVSSEIQTGV